MEIPQCPACGGSMSDNPAKTPGSKMPDYICNEDNGQCQTKTGYTTGAWKPKQKGSYTPQTPAKPKVDPQVWIQKERLSAAQTAINAAAQVHQQSGDDKKVIKSATEYYDFLRKAKVGLVGRAEEKKPEGDVDISDIPF